MKSKIYTMFMIAATAMTLISCGGTKSIKEYPAKSLSLSGTHSWYVDKSDEPLQLSTLPTDCDTLFYPAITLSLKLVEKVNLPKNMTIDFKDIQLNSYAYDTMKPTEEGRKELIDMLTGGTNNTKSITFVSKDKWKMADINKAMERDNVEFSISYLQFKSEGKVHKKELFNCVFDNAKIANVLTDYESLIEDLRKHYYAYEDDQTSDKYAKFEKLHKEATRYTNKLNECVENEDLSSSQKDRLESSKDAYNKINYKID